MSLQESLRIFNIKDPTILNKQLLKKEYRRLCLRYHPDKNKGGEEHFVKVQASYEYLLENMDKITIKDDNDDDTGNIDYIMSFLTAENLNYFMELIDKCGEFININNVPEFIHLDVTIAQVLSRSIYIVSDSCHIPLWHRFVHHYSVIDKKYFIFIINITDRPSYLKIENNNDIFVTLPKSAVKLGDNSISSLYFKNVLEFYVDEDILYKNKVCLSGKGIPRTNYFDLFDDTDISDIYIYWK